MQLWQTTAIGSFLLLGTFFLGFLNIVWWHIPLVLFVSVFLDWSLKIYLKQTPGFPFSAVNSGIGICLFLRSEFWPIMLFAAVLAIVSKYIVATNGRHFLNPSYSAIFLTLIFFNGVAYIDHFQWGNDWWVLLPILLAGLTVSIRTQLWDMVLAFWGTILLCLTMVDFSAEDFVQLFLTGSFIIMSFHGFTDPGTVPKLRKYRLLFAAQIALLFFVLRQFINEGYSFFAAYFLVNLLEILFWKLEGRYWRGFDLRLLIQSVFTLLLLCLLVFLSVQHYLEASATWPRLLTNRCSEILCQWGMERAW